MNVLFTIMPAAGHFQPIVPLARALRDAGHHVHFATAASFRPEIEAAGFRFHPAGKDFREIMAARTVSGTSNEQSQPTVPEMMRQSVNAQWMAWQAAENDRGMSAPGTTGIEAGGWQRGGPGTVDPSHFITRFGSATIEYTVPDLLALLDEWRPDVIVRSTIDLSGYLVGDIAGIPYATAGVGLLGARTFLQAIAGNAIAAARTRYDLPPDPDLSRLDRYLYLSFAPPSFQWSVDDLPTVHFIRPMAEDRTAEADRLPDWIAHLPTDRPTVYITLGTVFNWMHEVFATILAGVRDAPYNVIMTVGRNNDPASFGPQPDHVHIARYIPMSLLLPHCDAVIAHGGFNTTMTTLRHGLPLVLVPLSADQPMNAARCAELGVGLVLSPADLQPQAIGEAVTRVLTEPAFRARAGEMQREIAALPGPEHAVTLLARLARERQPLVRGT